MLQANLEAGGEDLNKDQMEHIQALVGVLKEIKETVEGPKKKKKK